MNRTIKAVLPHFRMSPAEILAGANAAYAGMKGNDAYLHPVVDPEVLKGKTDKFLAATVAAQGGGRQFIAERNRLGHELVKMLRQLAHYVEGNCNEDLATFISSGFVASTMVRTSHAPLSQFIRRIDAGDSSGQLRIALLATSGARSYELRWAPLVNGVANAWTQQAVVSTRPPTSITNLTPGTTYAFQVRALLKSGYTDWSDSVTRISM